MGLRNALRDLEASGGILRKSVADRDALQKQRQLEADRQMLRDEISGVTPDSLKDPATQLRMQLLGDLTDSKGVRGSLSGYQQAQSREDLTDKKQDFTDEQRRADEEFRRKMMEREYLLRSELAQKKMEAKGKPLTEGQKVREREAAKGVVEYEQNRDFVRSDIDLLMDVERRLEEAINSQKKGYKGEVIHLTGPKIGRVPGKDVFLPQTEEMIQQMAGITQKNLRKILGGQFAQKEGEQLIKRAFNPNLGEKWNLDTVRRLRNAMQKEQARREAESKALSETGFASDYKMFLGSGEFGSSEDRQEKKQAGASGSFGPEEKDLWNGTSLTQQQAQHIMNNPKNQAVFRDKVMKANAFRDAQGQPPLTPEEQVELIHSMIKKKYGGK